MSKRHYTRIAIVGANIAVLLLALAPLAPLSSEWLSTVSNFWLHLIPVSFAGALAAAFMPGLKRAAVFMLTPVVLGAVVYGSLGTPARQTNGDTSYKIITFNVLESNFSGAPAIRDFLISENADFVFILEVDGIYSVLDELRAVYPYQSDRHGESCAPAISCDLILLSRHPLLDIRRPESAVDRDRLIVADVDMNGQKITLAGVHLTKPLQEGQQTREVDTVGPILAGLPRPLIVAGDFNATPWSKVMRRLLELSDLRLDYGYRPSWPIWLRGMGLPIDHVLVGGELSVSDARVNGDAFGSNHFPMIVQIQPGT